MEAQKQTEQAIRSAVTDLYPANSVATRVLAEHVDWAMGHIVAIEKALSEQTAQAKQAMELADNLAGRLQELRGEHKETVAKLSNALTESAQLKRKLAAAERETSCFPPNAVCRTCGSMMTEDHTLATGHAEVL